jgi:FkbM family methyltransferase
MHSLPVSEPWGHYLFAPLLRAFPGTFVDVGVNLGQTLTRLRAVDRSTAYIGFEPNPFCIQYSRNLVRLNAFADSPIVPCGLGALDGVVDLVMNNDSLTDPGASMVQGFRPTEKVYHRLPVPVIRFATAERDMRIGKLGVVKIDVEGSEREVLLSMEHKLATDRPAIFLEILPSGREDSVDRIARQEDIEALFKRLNYRLNRILENGQEVRLDALNGPIGVHSDQSLSNYLVLPAERCEELLPQLAELLAHK